MITIDGLDTKGSLISESFSLWLKSPKNVPNVPNGTPEHLLFMWIMFRGVIWHLFLGDLSQREKLSEFKPPLDIVYNSGIFLGARDY